VASDNEFCVFIPEIVLKIILKYDFMKLILHRVKIFMKMNRKKVKKQILETKLHMKNMGYFNYSIIIVVSF
jgi:hypothetical protein